jgi:hypothetical protein
MVGAGRVATDASEQDNVRRLLERRTVRLSRTDWAVIDAALDLAARDTGARKAAALRSLAAEVRRQAGDFISTEGRQ